MFAQEDGHKVGYSWPNVTRWREDAIRDTLPHGTAGAPDTLAPTWCIRDHLARKSPKTAVWSRAPEPNVVTGLSSQVPTGSRGMFACGHEWSRSYRAAFCSGISQLRLLSQLSVIQIISVCTHLHKAVGLSARHFNHRCCSVSHSWLAPKSWQLFLICDIFFDLQKAFDSVPHRSLIAKLKQLNISEILLKWLTTWKTELSATELKVLPSCLNQSSQVSLKGLCMLGSLLFIINSNPLERAYSYKYLGIHSPHISTLPSKVQQQIGMLYHRYSDGTL